MSDATVTSKGQVTIPKDVRERLGLKPGDQIRFVEDGAGFRLTRQTGRSRLERWRGYAKDLAVQDPDKLIEEWRGR